MPETRKLGSWIDEYLTFTSNDEPRKSFRKFVAISTIAACLQRKCYLNWEETIFPNLYIVLVGPPASRKNTAIGPGEKMLIDLGIEVSAQATTRQALIRRLKKIGESVVTNEVSIIAPSDAAMTIVSKEFTVFLGIHNLELIALLCEWYDCDDNWKYETKTQGIDSIKNVWVNIIAGTTPTALKDSLPRESIGMGLTSRVIFIYEDDKEKPVFFSPNVDVYEDGKVKKLNVKTHFDWSSLRSDLLHDLAVISTLEGPFIPTGGYHKAYLEWRSDYEKNMPFKGTLLENYANRVQTHARKISMVFSASRSNGMFLESSDFLDAINVLREAEQKMNMAFSGIGKSDTAEIMDKIMRVIGQRRSIKLSELQKMFWSDADKLTLDKAIQTIEQMKFCKRVYTGNDTTIVYTEEDN